ncbi:MAG TPA: sulfatase [Thermoanaerobaculia bacterium]
MRTRLFGWLFLLLFLTACGRVEPERWNVLFVTVDTLRADRMSLYGYRRPTTPNLEAFAREAVVFDNARTQAGCTFPSVNSFLTSRHPALFLRPGGIMGIPDTVRSLPEILREHGHATAAVSASSIVRNTPSRMNPGGGFGRGFQVFDETCNQKHARCLNQKALELIDGFQEPWFLYLHYLEPHSPYQPPPGHPRRLSLRTGRAKGQGVNAWARKGETWPVARRLYDGNKEYKLTPQNLAHLSELYDEEIGYFDEQFARLIGALRERDLLDRTVIVLTADHGEELYDHKHFGHCRNLGYDTVMKTPLLLRIPGVEPARRKALAENLDIVPTLLDYMGLAKGHTFEGKSLRPVIEEDRPVRRLSFSLQGVSRTVSDGTHKLIYDIASGDTHLYDLRTDPGEKTDLSERRPAETGRLQAALLRWLEAREGPAASGESKRRAEELEKRLRALGYL